MKMAIFKQFILCSNLLGKCKEVMEERRGLKLERLSALAPSKSFEFPQNPQRWGNKNPLNFSNLQKLGM